MQPEKSRNACRKDAFILPHPVQAQGFQAPRRPATLTEAVAAMASFNVAAYERYYAGNPCLDHLLTLTKFNLLRAFMDNLQILGLSVHYIDEDDALSPFNSPPTGTKESGNLPTSLCPTTIQRSVPHHPWLDCFPFPQIRDNIINVGDTLHDCELCIDLMDPSDWEFGLLVWGDPWLPQNWEASESFVRKWPWIIKGCPEILASSNYWRHKRGLGRLNFTCVGK